MFLLEMGSLLPEELARECERHLYERFNASEAIRLCGKDPMLHSMEYITELRNNLIYS